MNKKKLVVLTGAGMSADSGISTFRDSGGLWDGFDVMEVASLEGWYSEPEKVLNFYNERRTQLKEASPNPGHEALAALEEFFDVTIITQNVDDLHERAGSKHIIHLHGELTKIRPENSDGPVADIGYTEIHWGDTDEKGRQFRPHIVWFGEIVPLMDQAVTHVIECDIFAVIGTSLAVYPAAGLVDLTPHETPVYVIDPIKPDYRFRNNVTFILESAAKGTPKWARQIISSLE